MDGGYPQGGGPPPQMLGYYSGVPGYTMPQVGMQGPSSGTRAPSSVSIWAGDLDSYMDENFLRNAVAACGWGADITRIKVVRDRFSGVHAGYGFLDAASPEAAQRVLATGSGMPIPGTNRCWRLNMGRSAAGASGPAAGSETNVYVGDLEPNVTDFQLMSAFRPRYSSVRHAKVVCNDYGHSRGFGFVRFGDAQEAERAVADMQGFEFHGKPIRLSLATGRSRGKNTGGGGGANSGYHGNSHAHHSDNAHSTNKRPRQLMSPDDPNNTTLFIGGTANHITEDLLWREFSFFGELEAVRVPATKTGFAFVRFKTRECAQRAKDELSRTHVVSLNPHKPVRLEWATEQLAVTRPPPPSISSLQNLSGPQSYDPHFTGQYMQPGAHQYGYGGNSLSNSNGAQNHSTFGAPGLVSHSVSHPSLSSPMPSGMRSAAMRPGNMANISSAVQGITGHTTPNGTTLSSDPLPGTDKRSAQEANKSADPQSLPSSAIGDTEPPSKRAAVGRSEYASNPKDSADPQVNPDEFKKSSTEGVPAAPFSWLNAPASQPSSAQQ